MSNQYTGPNLEGGGVELKKGQVFVGTNCKA